MVIRTLQFLLLLWSCLLYLVQSQNQTEMKDLVMSMGEIKAALFEQYDTDENAECISQLQNFTTNLMRYPFNVMQMAQTKDFFEMGSPKLCRVISDYATVVLRDEAISTLPGNFRFTICLPKQCANALFLDRVFTMVRKIIKRICHWQWSQTFIHEKMSNPVCSQNWLLPDEVVDTKKSEMNAAKNFWIFLMTTYLLLVVVSTIYDLFQRYIISQHQRKKQSLLTHIKNDVLQQKLLKRFLNSTNLDEDETLSQSFPHIKEKAGMDQGGDSLRSSTVTLEEDDDSPPNRRDSNDRKLMKNWTYESQTSLNSMESQQMTQVDFTHQNFSIQAANIEEDENSPVQEYYAAVIQNKAQPNYLLLSKRQEYSYLTVFSFARSFDKLFYRKPQSLTVNKDRPELLALDGVKVLTFVWVSFLVAGNFQLDMFMRNKWKFVENAMYNKYMWVFMIASQVGIDIFLMLSAFFLSTQIIKIAREYNGLSMGTVLQIYLNRFIRMVPMYYFVFFTGWIMIWYFGSGNMWMTYESLYKDCDKYWWTHFFFISNFIPAERKALDGCMTWAAYINVEIQLFVFLPVIFLVYTKYKTATIYFLSVMILIGTIICGSIIYAYNFIAGYLYMFDIDTTNAYGDKPYVRIDSYCSGILLALVYQKILWYQNEARKSEKKEEKVLRWLHKSHWAPFTMFSGFLTFAILHFFCYMHIDYTSGKLINRLVIDTNGETVRIANAFIMSFGKICMLISISLMMIFLFTGNYSLYFQLLGNQVFHSLRKLLFCGYLVLPIVSKAYLAQLEVSFYATMGSIFYLNFMNIVLALFIGMILYLLVECPLTDFIKMVITDIIVIIRKKRENTKKNR